MKKVFIISLVFISFLSSTSFGGKKYTYYGWGALSCADLLKSRTDSGMLNFLDNFELSSWIQGYVSAMNVSKKKTIDENTDFDGVILEIIKRCEKEPMNEISDELDWIYKNKMK